MDLSRSNADRVIVLGERYAKVEQALEEALILWEHAHRERSST
jgi:hypothetical protein